MTVYMKAAGPFEMSRITEPVTVSLARRLESVVKMKSERFEVITDVSLRVLECDAV
jgi:hypothetical protein